MELFTNSIEGVFVKRPNRFIVYVRTCKETVRAHCPNPGRLIELLIPGRKVILEKNRQSSRKTKYTLVAAYYQGKVISLYSAHANNIARDCVIPLLFPHAVEVLPEKSIASSRFDFLIKTKQKIMYLEVKACTLVEQGIGMFPDAPSIRATRHLNELAQLTETCGEEYEGHVLFIVMNPDCRCFVPNIHTDPEFSLTLARVENKISIHVVSVETGPDGNTDIHRLKIPYNLSPVQWVKKDSGVYMLVMHLEKNIDIQVGYLGMLNFKKGYYCYTGSALRNLSHRLKRHYKKKKKTHWHIDYLTKAARFVKAYPVYSINRQECNLAKEIKLISDGEIKGFGCSDCSCVSHLHYFKNNPAANEKFISVLFKFRHFRGKL